MLNILIIQKPWQLAHFILLGEYPKEGLPQCIAYLEGWSNDAKSCNSLLYKGNDMNQHHPQHREYYHLLWRRMWL